MVYNIIAPKLKSKLPKSESPLPEHYYCCPWQKTYEVSVWFIIYRIAMSLTTITIMILSIVEHKDEDPDGSRWKWLIYMTHWSYAMIVIQFIMASTIASSRIMQIRNNISTEPKITPLHRVYGSLHTTTSVMAFGVTSLYWILIYDPELHRLDFMNFAMHAFNSVIMLIDLLLISQPIQFLDILYPCLFSCCYLGFTFIYYICGGTGKLNRPSIYPILNWENPLQTLVVALFSLFFIILMHMFVFSLVLIRRKLTQNRHKMTSEHNPAFQDTKQPKNTTDPILDII